MFSRICSRLERQKAGGALTPVSTQLRPFPLVRQRTLTTVSRAPNFGSSAVIYTSTSTTWTRSIPYSTLREPAYATGPGVNEQLLSLYQQSPGSPELWQHYIELRDPSEPTSPLLPLDLLRGLIPQAVPNASEFPQFFSLNNQCTIDQANYQLPEPETTTQQRFVDRLDVLVGDIFENLEHCQNLATSLPIAPGTCPLAAEDVELIMGGYLQYGLLERAMVIFEQVTTLSIMLTPRTFQYLTFALVMSGQVETALDMRRELQTKRDPYTLATYEILLHGLIYTPTPEPDPEPPMDPEDGAGGLNRLALSLGNSSSVSDDARRSEQLMQVLTFMHEAGFTATQHTYDDIISGLILRHPVDAPEARFCDITTDGAQSTSNPGGNSSTAGSMPTCEAYTAVALHRCLKHQSNWAPTMATYPPLIQAYCTAHNVAHAWQLFKRYTGVGEKIPAADRDPQQPNQGPRVALSLIEGLLGECHSALQENIIRELFDMVQQGQVRVASPTSQLFEIFLRAFAFSQDPGPFKPLWLKLVRSHVTEGNTSSSNNPDGGAEGGRRQDQIMNRPRLNNACVTLAFEYCATHHDPLFLEMILGQLRQVRDLTLDEANYNELANTYCKLAKPEPALRLIQETMPQRGFRADIDVVKGVYIMLGERKLGKTQDHLQQWTEQHYSMGCGEYLADQGITPTSQEEYDLMVDIYERNKELFKDLKSVDFEPLTVKEDVPMVEGSADAAGNLLSEAGPAGPVVRVGGEGFVVHKKS